MTPATFDPRKIESFIEGDRRIFQFDMDFRGFDQQWLFQQRGDCAGFSEFSSSEIAYRSGELSDISVTYRRSEPLPTKAPDAQWIEAPESCYCAALGRMAPCGWCTDPANDPDAQEDSP